MSSGPQVFGEPGDDPRVRPALRLEVAGLSETGSQRQNNEDCFGYDLDQGIFLVCDGMGGMAAGEVASTVAVEEVMGAYRRLPPDDMQPEERLLAAIALANRTVWRLSQSRPELRGMGTTLVAACVHGDRIVVANVGDSRAYFLRDGGCVQITADHSVAGIPRYGSTEADPLQGFITRAVGAEPAVLPDFFTAALQPGDTVLLASDGLTRYFDANAIADQVHNTADLAEVCRSLASAVYTQGAADNLTCLLVRAREGRAFAPPLLSV